MDPKEFRRELRKDQTNAEGFLWQCIRNRQLEDRKFRRQHSISNYTVDFICIEEMLVIEVDGSSHDDVIKSAGDVERDEALRAKGYRILRFTNDEVMEAIETVLDHIKAQFSHQS